MRMPVSVLDSVSSFSVLDSVSSLLKVFVVLGWDHLGGRASEFRRILNSLSISCWSTEKRIALNWRIHLCFRWSGNLLALRISYCVEQVKR